MKTGIFVGSFDPFTVGHDSILRRALPLFDKIMIGVGVNERKKCMLCAEERTERIARLYANEPKDRGKGIQRPYHRFLLEERVPNISLRVCVV